MKAFVWVVGILIASVLPAQSNDYFRPTPNMTTYVVIMAGASVDENYSPKIRNWALALHDTLRGEYGYRPEQIILLMGEKPDPEEPRISGPCRTEAIQARLDGLKQRLKPGDRIFFLFLGHGTHDGQTARFVVHGPDLTGEAFAAMLDSLPDQDLVVIHTTSAGFPFCKALSGPGRVILCATRSSAEIYNTVYPGYFIDAFAGRAGDRDKNRRVSILEAFWYAGKGVQKWYEEQNRIPTEHAVLDDSGDGRFSSDPQPSEGDGRLAQIAYLDLLPGSLALRLPPGVDARRFNQMAARVRELERSVILLRDAKPDMAADVYQAELEKRLIELARASKKLRLLTDRMD